MDDAQIVALIKKGEVDRYETLVNRYRVHVVRVVSRHVPGRLVDELCQDVFVRAYQALPGLREPAQFKGWLSAIAVRTCLDHWRKAYRSREIPESALSREHHDRMTAVVNTESCEQYEETRRQDAAREVLSSLLDSLSPEDRMVLELVHLEGLSGKEAAGLLGWSVANVKIRAFRARRKLKDMLGR